jgi:hypothetical protein
MIDKAIQLSNPLFLVYRTLISAILEESRWSCQILYTISTKQVWICDVKLTTSSMGSGIQTSCYRLFNLSGEVFTYYNVWQTVWSSIERNKKKKTLASIWHRHAHDLISTAIRESKLQSTPLHANVWGRLQQIPVTYRSSPFIRWSLYKILSTSPTKDVG